MAANSRYDGLRNRVRVGGQSRLRMATPWLPGAASWNSGYMLMKTRMALETASFLEGKVSGASTEKVVKGVWSPMLTRSRMENRPRYVAGRQPGGHSVDLIGRSNRGSGTWMSLSMISRWSELAKSRMTFSIDLVGVAASVALTQAGMVMRTPELPKISRPEVGLAELDERTK